MASVRPFCHSERSEESLRPSLLAFHHTKMIAAAGFAGALNVRAKRFFARTRLSSGLRLRMTYGD
jgi:hypothetical protein